MDDLISRQAAMDMFQSLADDDWNKGVGTSWAEAYLEAAEMIWNLPAAHPDIKIGKWIPCSERLPEDNVINPLTQDFQKVICSCNFSGLKDVRTFSFGNGHFLLGGQIMDKRVIAWMPLPEPYKEDADD